jgi:uncharacterized protein YaiE (UPF0345 family)
VNITLTTNAGPVNIGAATAINMACAQTCTIDPGLDFNVATAGGSISLIAHADMTLQTGHSANLTVNAGICNFSTAQDYNITTGTSFDVTSTGKINLVSNTNTGNVSCYDGSGNGLLRLLTEAFLNAFNNHTHGGVATGGGTSGTPSAKVNPGYPETTNCLIGN